MFRGGRGRRLIGARLLLAATALSAQTWRTLLVRRGHYALLLPWHGGTLRRGRYALLLPWHGGTLRRGHGALLPWPGGLMLLSRGHGTLALARNGALRWWRRPLG
jgi:hypothetical protein